MNQQSPWRKLGLAVFATMLVGSVFAKTITLFDQPNANAKSIGSIDAAQGVVPIFTTKDGEWVKVGDPKNGNVGWIKSSDLKDPNSPVSITYTQQYINNGNEPQAFQFIQYGPPHKMSKEEAQALVKKLQMDQQQLHKSMENIFNSMFQELNQRFPMMDRTAPIFMPVVIMPQQESSKASATVPTPPATPSSTNLPKK